MIITVLAALASVVFVDARRYVSVQEPIFAIRSSTAVPGGTRTEYRGLWYRASVIRYDDADRYAHMQLGPGDLLEPPVDPQAMIDAVSRRIERQDMSDAGSRTDGEGHVLGCLYPDDDYGGACTMTRVGTGLVSFSRVRILDWAMEGETLKAYVYSCSSTYFLSSDGDHIVLDSGGEATWTAVFRRDGASGGDESRGSASATDGRWTLQDLRTAGDGVSSQSIRQSDWPPYVQRMFLTMPHEAGNPAGNQAMDRAIDDEARAHFSSRTKDTRIYGFVNGEFMPLDPSGT